MRRAPAVKTPCLLALTLACLVLTAGCASIGVTPVDPDVRYAALDRSALNSDRPSERTANYLALRDLTAAWKDDPAGLIVSLDASQRAEPDPGTLFALVELSHLQAKQAKYRPGDAAGYHLACAVYAYRYLFDLKSGPSGNVYHPYARLAAMFYNHSLGRYLLYVRDNGVSYEPGQTLPFPTGSVALTRRVSEFSFKPEEFSKVYLAFEFEVEGLTSTNVTPGLGVPLVLVRDPDAPGAKDKRPEDAFLPRITQSYAATAFLRLDPNPGKDGVYAASLEIYDPMRTDRLLIGQTASPLESDLTTPLALMIQNAPASKGLAGLLDPGALSVRQGLYMLQPYQADKIPVVLVHGLMSSPWTWMQMLNGLMADPKLRERYQFWFYAYPTGNPVLYSAANLRFALAQARSTFDPAGTNPNFSRMIVVGHSMGGLLTKTTVIEGGDRLWEAISDVPLDALEVTPEQKAMLTRLVYFTPMPEVSRVVFIATPHRGSDLALGLIGRIGRSLVTLPLTLIKVSTALFVPLIQNGGKSAQLSRWLASDRAPTGIDSLSPDNPGLMAMVNTPITVPYHSIIGNNRQAGVKGGTDGIVPYTSAHLDGAQSELVVFSGHSAQENPLTIREVRRILLLHADDSQTRLTQAR